MKSTDKPTEQISRQESTTVLSEKRILVVDDEPLITRIVLAHLLKGGYRNARSENDSRNAIKAMREFQPDMVLLDINMPHMCGLTLLEQISANTDFDNVIVLMLSAAGDEEENKSFNLGALGFLPKPVTAESIIRIVSSTFRIAMRFGTR